MQRPYVSENFNLMKYYHSYIVEYSERATTLNMGFIYGPLLESVHESEDLTHEMAPPQAGVFRFPNRTEVRVVALIAGGLGVLNTVLMLVERILFCISECTLMVIHPKRRQWKLLPYTLLAHVNELMILPFNVSYKILSQMCLVLRNPEKGVRKISKEQQEADNWIVDHKKWEIQYSAFFAKTLTDEAFEKQRSKGMNILNLSFTTTALSMSIAGIWLTARLMFSMRKNLVSRCCC